MSSVSFAGAVLPWIARNSQIDGHADYLLDDASGKLTVSGVPHIQGCEEGGEHPDGREIARLLDERRAPETADGQY